MSTLRDYWNTGDDNNYAFYGVNWYCQTFTASSTYDIVSVKLKLYRVGSPGTVYTYIRTTDGTGKPSGSNLAIGSYNGNTLTTDTAGEWVTFTLGNTVALSSGVKYAIVIAAPSGSTPSNYVRGRTDTSSGYANGASNSSADSGGSWGTESSSVDWMFETYGDDPTVTDKTYSRRLVAIGNQEIWYESSAGTMAELSDANGDINAFTPLEAIEAFQKIFIVNGTKLRVIDFVNSKLTTTDAGANPCTKGMTLTGGSSNATMIVDYVDGVTDDAAANVYGYNDSIATFTSGETVTGTNSAGNAVSFVLSAAEDLNPHWYNWTVFGNDTTNYGTMPTSSSLIALYRGRLVINDDDRPHAWYMSKVENPWKFLYDFTNDGDISAISYTNTRVGEVGDIITAFITYKDDLFIFGCANSIWVLMGDPLAGGQLAEVTNVTGIWGSRSWCIGEDKSLYFLGNDGIYHMPLSESTSPPENISRIKLPNLISDLDLDKSLHRVLLSYDPVENGIIISKTLLTDGTNTDYFFSLTTQGFFPESYPTSCGIFSSYYYPATDETYKKFLVGCTDGYVREFDPDTKNDTTTSSTSAISSYLATIQQIGEDEFSEAMLRKFCGIVSGGASSGDFSDADAVSYELHTGDDAETVLEDIKDGATAFASGTWSTTGKQNITRPRMRGTYAGLKLYNSTASQTWSVEKVYGETINKGVK